MDDSLEREIFVCFVVFYFGYSKAIVHFFYHMYELFILKNLN